MAVIDNLNVLRDKLVALADSIRAKNGMSDPMTLDEMTSAIEEIETGGVNEADVLNEAFDPVGEYVLPRGVLSIPKYAFTSKNNMTGFTAYDVTYLGDYAFAQCNNLKTVKFHNDAKLNFAGQYMFTSCGLLETVEFNSVNVIPSYAFYACKSLRSFDSKDATTLGYSAFYNCTSLESFVSKTSKVEASAFSNCSRLESFECDCQTQTFEFSSSCFSNCRMLDSVIIKNAKTIKASTSSSFANSKMLENGSAIFLEAEAVDAAKTLPGLSDVKDKIYSLEDLIRDANVRIVYVDDSGDVLLEDSIFFKYASVTAPYSFGGSIVKAGTNIYESESKVINLTSHEMIITIQCIQAAIPYTFDDEKWSMVDYDGRFCVKSNAIRDNESTVVRCTFSGITSITFDCRYDGENNYDYLTIGNIDATCTRSAFKSSMKGNTGKWMQYTYECDAGEHYVEFCYSKDSSQSVGLDCAWVSVASWVKA